MRRVLLQLIFCISLIHLAYWTFPGTTIFAQGEQSPSRTSTLEAVVIDILEEKNHEVAGKMQPYQKMKLMVTDGVNKGSDIIVENGTLPMANANIYKKGDRLIVTGENAGDTTEYYISDYIRRTPLYILVGLFVFVTIVVSGIRGIMSFVGMILSFGVILFYMIPNISQGSDPVLIAIFGSVMIIPITFYLSHGVSLKTTVAVIGTLISLVVTGVLTNVFVHATRLTGFASEEATFLQVAKGGTLNLKGLLIAGIIIGVLGVLDDITVAQASIVQELKKANQSLTAPNLFRRAMNVGRDHISSMVNTLVLVYAGASLPLLVLFVDNSKTIREVLNYEVIADEIVRTMVGSTGLVLAVPITTLVAVYFFSIFRK